MKYLKMFEGHQSESEVAKICRRYRIRNWSLVDGLVNVDGDVHLDNIGLTELPLKFGTVTGTFDCRWNNLMSLVGCPNRVGGSFHCSNNLRSLVGCPNRVGGNFNCSGNKLSSLEGCPKYVGSDFYCQWNNIREFDGIKYIVESFNILKSNLDDKYDLKFKLKNNSINVEIYFPEKIDYEFYDKIIYLE